MASETRQLAVEGLPSRITQNRIKFFFMNKNKNGGGPIENIEYNEENGSALITFQHSDAVDRILKRGDTVQIMDNTVHVSAFRSGHESESEEFFDSVDQCADSVVPSANNCSARQLKVEGLPEGIAEGRLKAFFRNTNKNGGGPIEKIDLANGKAIITFESADAVKLILSRGDTVEISKTTVTVSAVKDENMNSGDENQYKVNNEDETECNVNNEDENQSSVNNNGYGNQNNVNDEGGYQNDVRHEEFVRDVNNEDEDQGNPSNEDEDVSHEHDNQREVDDDENGNQSDDYSDEDNFKPDSDEDIPPQGKDESVSHCSGQTTSEEDDSNDSDGEDSEFSCDEKSNLQQHSREDKETDSSSSENEDSDAEFMDKKATSCSVHSEKKSISDSDTSPTEPKKVSKEDENGNQKENRLNVEKDSGHENRETFIQNEDQSPCTVKLKISDVTKRKDCYIFYFESGQFSSFAFDENSLILDGFLHCVYVTFNKKEDALFMCQHDHKIEEGSNILSIAVASDEDLQFYPDMISIHGLDFTTPGMKEKLGAFIKDSTGIYPSDILQGEEPESAIIKFPDKDFNFIYEATWKCASKRFDNNFLATAPVHKSRSILVSVDLAEVELPTLKLYMSNNKRSAGGPVELCEESGCGAKVTFKSISDQENVLKKGSHKACDAVLELIPFHNCLTKSAYNNYLQKKKKREKSLKKRVSRSKMDTTDSPKRSSRDENKTEFDLKKVTPDREKRRSDKRKETKKDIENDVKVDEAGDGTKTDHSQRKKKLNQAGVRTKTQEMTDHFEEGRKTENLQKKHRLFKSGNISKVDQTLKETKKKQVNEETDEDELKNGRRTNLGMTDKTNQHLKKTEVNKLENRPNAGRLENETIDQFTKPTTKNLSKRRNTEDHSSKQPGAILFRSRTDADFVQTRESFNKCNTYQTGHGNKEDQSHYGSSANFPLNKKNKPQGGPYMRANSPCSQTMGGQSWHGMRESSPLNPTRGGQSRHGMRENSPQNPSMRGQEGYDMKADSPQNPTMGGQIGHGMRESPPWNPSGRDQSGHGMREISSWNPTMGGQSGHDIRANLPQNPIMEGQSGHDIVANLLQNLTMGGQSEHDIIANFPQNPTMGGQSGHDMRANSLRNPTTGGQPDTRVDQKKDSDFIPQCQSQQIIKAKVLDVTKSKRSYMYYFESILQSDKFDESQMILDALNQCLYVTFDTSQDADTICQLNKTDQKSNNILSVEKALAKDIQFYNNLISIHGPDFTAPNMKDKLCQFVLEKVGLIPEIVFGEEPRSALAIFDKSELNRNIYEMAWDCASKMEDIKVIAAPVCHSSTVIVSGDLSKIEQNSLLHFLSIAKRGGGKIKTFKRSQEDKLLVTFEDFHVCDKLVRKGELEFENVNLKLHLYHNCLSQEAYQHLISTLPQSSQQTAIKQKKEPMKKFTATVTMKKLPKTGCIALKRSSMEADILKDYPSASVKINIDESNIAIEAETDEDLNAVLEIVYDYKSGLSFDKLTKLDPHVQDYLSSSDAEKRINGIFENKNIAACLSNKKVYYYQPSFKEADKIMKTSVINHNMKLSPSEVSFLKAEKSRKFREKMQQEMNCLLNCKSDGESFFITGFEEDTRKFKRSVKQYLSDQKIEEKSLPLTQEKVQFMEQFCASDLEQLQAESKKSGGNIEFQKNKITLKGPDDFVNQAYGKLKTLSDRINCQDLDLKYNGIEEYLLCQDGQRMLKNVGDQSKSLIFLKGHNMSQIQGGGLPQPQLVGDCLIGTKKINFLLGDFWSLDVDAIICIASESFTMANTKAVFLCGGDDLKNDFNQQFSRSMPTESIIETKGGNLPCAHVFHIYLKMSDTSVLSLRNSLKKCLVKADEKGYKTIAFPLLGCDEFNWEPLKAVASMKTVITDFLNEKSSLHEINLCDKATENVVKLMEKFENVNEHKKLATAKKSRKDKQNVKKKFGSVSLLIKSGNLLREKCDVIASGIKEHMDLSQSGGVSKSILKTCGQSIQDECSAKAQELAQDGVILTSATGLSCSNVIHANMNKYGRRWDQGVSKILQLADEKGLKSLALPTFGAGSKGVNHNSVKNSIEKGITDFSKTRPKVLHDIRLIISSQSLLSVFTEDNSDEAEDGETDERSVTLSSISIVIVLSDKVENRQKASRLLREELGKVYLTKKCHGEVDKLTSHQKTDLVNKAAHLGIKVEISNTDIEMSGFNQSGLWDSKEHLNQMISEVKDKNYSKMLKSVSAVKTWQYFRNDKWTKFDGETNVKIEAAYMQKERQFTVTDSKGHYYIIDFESMKEFTSDDGTKKGRELCPVKRIDSRADGYLPKKWDQMGPDENLKVVEVKPGSKEFVAVETNFRNGGATAAVKKIERVQNKALYQQYDAKLKGLARQNVGHENEKRLFHGTDATTVSLISESGFNRSYCGKNATAYGDGVYFAVDSSYSVNYASPDSSGERRMFQARVLVGESTPSRSGMRVLPLKPGTNIPYDSGSANNIYIIFHDAQAYPEYIIYF